MHVLNPKTRPAPDPNNPFPLAAECDVEALVSVPIAPPVPVGPPPWGMLRPDPTFNVVGFATAEADGTLLFPEGIARILLAETLNFVCAREISELP
jgi:hypothetical protein